MTTIRRNLFASYAGHGWAAAMGFAFTPWYLSALGPEKFGLIAFMLSLQGVSMMLDLGVSSFTARELARRSSNDEARGSIRGLVRTLEVIAWSAALVLGSLLYLASDLVADHWLSHQQMSRQEVASAIALIAAYLFVQWPIGLYTAALLGLEQLVALNKTLVVFSTLRFAGVIPFLSLPWFGLEHFIGWNIAFAGAHTIALAWILHKKMPPSTRPNRPQWSELRTAWRFAFGVFTVTSLGVGLSQMDRLVMSATRPLSEFGEYGLAVALAAGLGRLIQPAQNALYPRMSYLASRPPDAVALSSLYHGASQMMAVLMATACCVTAMNAQAILYLWTGDAGLAGKLALPLALLAIGTGLNGLASIPFALQLAHGWTRLGMNFNLFLLASAIPAYFLMIRDHGMVGAGVVWIGINLAYVLLAVPFMHKRLLPGELGRWYLADLMPAIAAATVASTLMAALSPSPGRNLTTGAWLLATVLIVSLASIAAAPALRMALDKRLRNATR